MKRLAALIQDHPALVSLLAFLLVAFHLVLAVLGRIPNTWAPLTASADVGISIYLGAASAAAIVAGFAGVVVVFGLTASGVRFRQLRLRGAASLSRNWTSASVSGFAAAGLSLAAAVLASLGAGQWSPWFFEWSMLLLLHGTVRIIWLLRALMAVVQTEDQAADRASRQQTVSTSDFQ